MPIPLLQVPRLTHHRHVDPDFQTGAEALLEYFDGLGYQADWTWASADQHSLPQSRARIYIVATKAMPPRHCKHEAHSKVAAALSLFRRLAPAGPPEDLNNIMQRAQACQQHLSIGGKLLPVPVPNASGPDASEPNASNGKSKAKAKAKGKSKPHKEPQQSITTTASGGGQEEQKDPLWPIRHKQWTEKHLANVDLSGKDSFMNLACLTGMSERCREVMFFQLTHWSVKNERPWDKEPVLVTVPGNSISWCPIQSKKFPCLTPGGTFVVFQRGKGRLANGVDCLFLQGLQQPEISKWELHNESLRTLQDLAGNAFTSNVFCALLAACLCKM